VLDDFVPDASSAAELLLVDGLVSGEVFDLYIGAAEFAVVVFSSAVRSEGSVSDHSNRYAQRFE